jgi:alpha-glucosidase (family GH31 glycosyl hydrolase)
MVSTHNPLEQGGKLTQHVWANHTVFLDFFDEGAKDVWAAGINALYNLFPFDGLWLDMNEATGFCNGECPDGLVPNISKSEQSNNFLDLGESIANYSWWYGYNEQMNMSTYEIPFIPGGKWNLDNMSMSLNATHPSTNHSEYDTHSLYAHSEGKATREILLDDTVSPLKDKRTFLLSRSTFAGSG